MSIRNNPEEANLPENTGEHRNPKTGKPPWEENALLRLYLAMAG
jgi:hypothetical protein